MNLQTKITVAAPDFLIDYNSRLMMLGSCFAENMGSKFSYYKFDVDVNPCGIIYNPLSVTDVPNCSATISIQSSGLLIAQNSMVISSCLFAKIINNEDKR